MKKLFNLERIVYFAFCAVALAALFPSVKLSLGGIRELGPGLLPFVINLCMLAFGILLILFSLVRRKKAPPKANVEKMDRLGWIRVSGILLSLAVWPVLVNMIGYILATFLVSLGMSKTIGYEGWVKPTILGVCVASSIWFVFGFMFNTDLPAGLSF